ncbi:YneF family protein [Brevibacillus sp. SYP-B805]|uniref:YneF family protein n=1 Tax=Brevibacillus sp. SYP-B805 TaxID=1578199 RepID=UPI0013EBFB02|nr:YneF family protein [Brevibacillus sp. SYP-B805]NGQ97398.1 YneF family protein [Brevibacillus sp. SYP-B805]
MWQWIIPILTLLAGLIGGFFLGAYYLRRQLSNMQMDDKQLQAMARSMGVNLNQKQLKQMSRTMKNMKLPNKPGRKA